MLETQSRLSIARLMVVVSIVAIDCGILRAAWDNFIEIAVIFLPTLNFMVLGFSKMWQSPKSRPFWIGFEVAATSLIGVIWLLIWIAPMFISYPAEWLSDNRWIYLSDKKVHSAIIAVLYLTWIAIFYALPQLLAAWFVGWLSARYRFVIERRPRAADAQVGVDVDLANGRLIEC
jgi:hypothetical protein